jgi:hypothetical protein
LLREGSTLFDRGDYAAALQKFEDARAVFPSPKIWFNVGAADRALARQVEALDAFQRFLDEAPDAPAESRREAQQAVAALKPALAGLNVECALGGVEVTIDGKSAGVTPIARAIWATPGRHQIAARREGMVPVLQEVTLVAGEERPVALDLRPLAPVAASAPAQPASVTAPVAVATPSLLAPVQPQVVTDEQRSITHRWWFWTAIGAVAAAGIVGIVLATRGGGTDVPRTTLGSQGFP